MERESDMPRKKLKSVGRAITDEFETLRYKNKQLEARVKQLEAENAYIARLQAISTYSLDNTYRGTLAASTCCYCGMLLGITSDGHFWCPACRQFR